jgi:hypothetical protein
MSLIKFSKWDIEAINSQMTNFFLDDQKDKHKYHLSNWYSLDPEERAWRDVYP